MAVAIKILRLFYHLTIPGGLLLALAAIMIRMGMFSDPLSQGVRLMPYVVFAAGLVLSVTFNRSRLFFALLVLVLAEGWLGALQPGVAAAGSHAIFDAIALLLPVNLLLFSFTRDSGVISQRGRRKLMVLAAQIVAVVLLSQPFAARAAALLNAAPAPRYLSDWSRVPQMALLAFVIAAAVLAAGLVRRYDIVQSSLLWALAAAFFALRTGDAGHLASVYLASAGFMLIMAVLEVSYNMAYLDDLTQLPSRRAFNQAMLKLGDSYTIAMVDVDHFKKFNDTYGHESGDEALRMVASKLARVAGGGRAYRYGGEEFAVLFPGKPAEEAVTYLEGLRRLIEHSTFVVRGLDRRKNGSRRTVRGGKKETHVTVSIGVSATNGERTAPEEILRVADQALYRAKQKGRNCTVASRSGKPAKSVKATNFGARVISVE
ncbi:MAG TPA: GGDEF domain-containing protein [Candidatus Saccharimonadales bacterium]|nr:GGDEF domain-containing protein [Candidatus Saccharimonadales bacterium]